MSRVVYLISTVLFFIVGAVPGGWAEEVAGGQSIDQCLAEIGARIQVMVFDQDTPACALTTPDGVTINTYVLDDIFKPSGLLSSNIAEFFRSSVFLWPGEAGALEAQLVTVPTNGVYRVAISARDATGAVTGHSDRSAGGGPAYAVLGQDDMYYVRCNAGSRDDCAFYTGLFARQSPNGEISKPGGFPWTGQDRPCYIFVRFSFHELGDGAGLPSVIAASEALAERSAGSQIMNETYKNYCNGSRKQ